MGSNIVKVVQFTKADELLQALGPASEYFRTDDPYSWIFRGVLSNDYQLIPSVLREGALEKVKIVTPAEPDRHIEFECEVLQAFAMLADRRGLPLPEDSQRMRSLLRDLRDRHKWTRLSVPVWPPEELLSLCGLAQHYGIPTRLLDWTYDPQVAAFFAARGVMTWVQEKVPAIRDAIRQYCSLTETPLNDNAATLAPYGSIKSKTMAVWAFNKNIDEALRTWYESGEQVKDEYGLVSNDEPVPYEIVGIPYASIPNAQAQQGLFTVVQQPLNAESIDSRPLDEIVSEYVSRILSNASDSQWETNPVFLRFELPWSEFAPLLVLLAKAGVNGSVVFPGYENVFGAVQEKFWWWDAWIETHER